MFEKSLKYNNHLKYDNCYSRDMSLIFTRNSEANAPEFQAIIEELYIVTLERRNNLQLCTK